MSQDIQWFPGHMTKTLRQIERSIKSVDIVAEIVDARAPRSSRSPELTAATIAKPRLLVLNKTDLAEDALTARWRDYYKKHGYSVVAIDARSQQAKSALRAAVEKLRPSAQSRYKPRIMMIGTPNSGKSTIINRLSGAASAKAEDRPGVTRGMQWVSSDFAELLDMPGVLCKKFDDRSSALRMAFIGSINDDILDTEELARELIVFLIKRYPERLPARYKLTGEPSLETIAASRGMLQKGGEPDLERASAMLLDEFRAGKLGKFTLEAPPDDL